MLADSTVIRRADHRDSLAFWRIRNHESVRAVSHDSAPIPLPQHERWYAGFLAKADALAYVIEVDQAVAGYCRVDHGLISIALLPEAKGKGYGLQLLTATTSASHDRWPTLTAEVQHTNLASKRLFEKAGYTLQPGGEAIYTFTHTSEQ